MTCLDQTSQLPPSERCYARKEMIQTSSIEIHKCQDREEARGAIARTSQQKTKGALLQNWLLIFGVTCFCRIRSRTTKPTRLWLSPNIAPRCARRGLSWTCLPVVLHDGCLVTTSIHHIPVTPCPVPHNNLGALANAQPELFFLAVR
jgi:hypothetical protein